MISLTSLRCFFGWHKWSEIWRRYEYPDNINGYVRVNQKMCLRCHHRNETKTLVEEI